MSEYPSGFWENWTKVQRDAWLETADLDYKAPKPKAKVKGNGPDARAQSRFKIVPFDKISFDTTPAYSVKGIIRA